MEKSGLFFRYRILWHILFWIAWYFFYAITYGSYNDNYSEELLVNLYLLPVRMLGAYAFIYLILPLIVDKKEYGTFVLSTIVHAILFGTGLWLIFYFFIYCQGCVYESEVPILNFPKILGTLISNYSVPTTAAAIVLFKKSFKDQQYARELEKQKIEAELKYLKAQIHPHFLFNTLNNLYALTLRKSEKASDVVIKLSEMLDYIIYNSNEREVKLEDEIRHIHAYIALEKIRYGDRLHLNIKIKGDAKDKYIAPLILLPFVENSFKHGASSEIDNPEIEISLEINENNLTFVVSNTFNETIKKESYTEGIGLKNVKRRLELIYPELYHLNIEKQKNKFQVILRLRWENKVVLTKDNKKLVEMSV